jgi:hypothetical protein
MRVDGHRQRFRRRPADGDVIGGSHGSGRFADLLSGRRDQRTHRRKWISHQRRRTTKTTTWMTKETSTTTLTIRRAVGLITCCVRSASCLGKFVRRRVPYRLARAALDRPRRSPGGCGHRSTGQSRDRKSGRRCLRAVCSRWHNLGSWRRALMGDYRHGGSSNGPGGSVGGGLGGVERPVYSLAPLTLPDYEHPRLLLLLPPMRTGKTRLGRYIVCCGT